jgi:hypothetical protein
MALAVAVLEIVPGDPAEQGTHQPTRR